MQSALYFAVEYILHCYEMKTLQLHRILVNWIHFDYYCLST